MSTAASATGRAAPPEKAQLLPPVESRTATSSLPASAAQATAQPRAEYFTATSRPPAARRAATNRPSTDTSSADAPQPSSPRGRAAHHDRLPRELACGELSPLHSWVPHARVTCNLLCLLTSALRGKATVLSQTSLILDAATILLPDLMAVTDAASIGEDGVYAPPALIIEVASPASARRDYAWKRARYDAAAIPKYWIADPIGRTVFLYRRDCHYRLENVYNLLPPWESEYLPAAAFAALQARSPQRIPLRLAGTTLALEDIFAGLIE